MTGNYSHSIDSKGRLFIPAKLREQLGSIIYVTLSPEKCLTAYSDESWQAFSERVRTMKHVEQTKMRPLFAYASRCEVDGQGRILLPQNLRDFAGLEKNVTVVGCNTFVQLWDSGEWEKVNALEITPDNIKAVMEELQF